MKRYIIPKLKFDLQKMQIELNKTNFDMAQMLDIATTYYLSVRKTGVINPKQLNKITNNFGTDIVCKYYGGVL